MKRLSIFIAGLFMVAGCSDPKDKLPQPQVQDAKQEMRDVMKYTAQVVSQVVASPAARNEVLGYAFSEFDGEVEASFDKLLSDEPKTGLAQRSLVNGAPSGKFAELFRPRAKQYVFESEDERSESVNDAISRLESYLKKHNLGLYGPYLAENHANSTKPITVSFDPLDDTKTTSTGYMFVPKSTSGNSSANNGGIDSPKSYYDGGYELVNIGEIDDDYAYNNPTLAIIPLGYPFWPFITPPTPTPTGPRPRPNNGINCQDLLENDILVPHMVKYRLKENLRWGFWNRNLLDLYAITKDDVTINLNGDGVINTNTSKLWTRVRVSRKDARKQRWKTANQELDSNWRLDERNLHLAFAGKKRVWNASFNVSIGNFPAQPNATVSANIKVGDKREVLYTFSHDKCATTSLYKTASLKEMKDGRRIYGNNMIEYTLDIEWYR